MFKWKPQGVRADRTEMRGEDMDPTGPVKPYLLESVKVGGEFSVGVGRESYIVDSRFVDRVALWRSHPSDLWAFLIATVCRGDR